VTSAVRCGGLLDPESGRVRRNVVVHVADDARITAIADDGDGIPDGATIVDLTNLTVLPGLIDTHTHLVGEVQTAFVPGTTTSAAEDVLIGVRHAVETLRAGFKIGRAHV